MRYHLRKPGMADVHFEGDSANKGGSRQPALPRVLCAGSASQDMASRWGCPRSWESSLGFVNPKL